MGEDADLPCYLSPEISAEDMEMRWYRDQPSPAVHVHWKGKDVPEEQMALYQGRTTFLKDGVAQGRASVRIHNVITFDNGTFHCQFNDSTVSAEATLWLRVAGKGGRQSPWSPRELFPEVSSQLQVVAHVPKPEHSHDRCSWHPVLQALSQPGLPREMWL